MHCLSYIQFLKLTSAEFFILHSFFLKGRFFNSILISLLAPPKVARTQKKSKTDMSRFIYRQNPELNHGTIYCLSWEKE